MNAKIFFVLLILLSAGMFLDASALQGLKMPEGKNLLKNPRLLPGDNGKIPHWSLYAPTLKAAATVIAGRKVARFTSLKNGYHYGPVTRLPRLKAGYRYLFAMIAKGSIGGVRPRCCLLYYAGSKKYPGKRQFIGRKWRPNETKSFDWQLFTNYVVTPKNFSGSCSLYAATLHGIVDLMIAEVGLYEIGPVPNAPVYKAAAEKSQSVRRNVRKTAAPEIKSVTDYSEVKPANVRIHRGEKVLPASGGNKVFSDGKRIVMEYAFGTKKHDALFFDLNKKALSCRKLTMDITSDGKGHRLALVLLDASGESHLVMLTHLKHRGKKHFSFDLRKLLPQLKEGEVSGTKWGGNADMKVDLPLRKITFVLDDVPDSSTGRGRIVLEHIKLGNW